MELPPRNIRTHLAMVGAGAFGGAWLGTLLNTINMMICCEFFGRDDVAAGFAVVAMGAFFGGLLGLLGSAALAIVCAASTRLRCTQQFALMALATAAVVICGAWFAGGVLGAALRIYAPSLSDSLFQN